MRTRSIGWQLTMLVAAFVVVTLVAVGVLSYQSFRSASQSGRLAQEAEARNQTLFALVNAVSKNQGIAQQLLREKDPDAMEKLIEQGKALGEAAESSIRAADAGIGVLGAPWQKLRAANDKGIAILLQGERAQAQEVFLGESNPAYEGLLEAIGQLQRRVQQEAAAQTAASSSANARLQVVVSLLVLAGLGGLATLGLLLVRRIVAAVRRAAEQVAEGAEQVAGAASQVSHASQALAQGASEQAASLEETSASSEEINSMSRQNAQSARAAAKLTSESQRKFGETNQALESMVTAMNEINASSDKVAKIIKVIDEIAFQTNILALNAAVEAARAGEAGMGFAVVADEVRNLAQRSAQAARDTTVLIEESIARSNEGKSRVNQVVASIRALTEDSSRVKTMLDEVSVGSEEQSRGIEQVAKAIQQMEQVTQRSAASAEESASASEELTAQSETLREVVDGLAALVNGGAARG